MRILGVVLLVAALVAGAVYAGARTDAGRQILSDFVDWAETHDKAVVSIGTAFLAVFTVVLAIATIFLWSATQDLVQEAKDTAERQLRAYVHLSHATVQNLTTGNGEVLFTINLKNYGQTPAYKISISIAVDLLPFPTTDIASPSAKPLSNLTLGPGAEHTMTVRRTAFNQTEIADLATTRALYLHGNIEYVDAFKTKHVTGFRLVKGGGKAYPTAGADLYSANEGNEAD